MGAVELALHKALIAQDVRQGRVYMNDATHQALEREVAGRDNPFAPQAGIRFRWGAFRIVIDNEMDDNTFAFLGGEE